MPNIKIHFFIMYPFPFREERVHAMADGDP